MPQPAHFQQVIARVIDRNAGKQMSAAQLAEAIVDGLDLAEDLMGNDPTKTYRPDPRQRVSIETPFRRPDPVLDLSVGVILQGSSPGSGAHIVDVQEEAPPAAVILNPGGATIQDTYEESERKKTALQAMILERLPAGYTVELPGIGVIKLIRFVRPAPMGAEFIRVLYAQTEEEQDAPQLQFFTSNMTVDPVGVKNEILKQAAAKYRKQILKIEPRQAQTQGMPDVDNMVVSRDPAHRAEDPSAEEIRDWNKHSGRSVI